MDGFAHVMVPTTTLRVEYVKVQHQKIWQYLQQFL